MKYSGQKGTVANIPVVIIATTFILVPERQKRYSYFQIKNVTVTAQIVFLVEYEILLEHSGVLKNISSQKNIQILEY